MALQPAQPTEPILDNETPENQDSLIAHDGSTTDEQASLQGPGMLDGTYLEMLDNLLLMSPTSDLIIEPTSLWSGLPSLVPLTGREHEAIDHFQKEIGFSIGTKSPLWSTHAILLQLAAGNATVLHLLLAASFSELDWARGTPSSDSLAKMHFTVGQGLLLDSISSANEPDHLIVMASFWLLFLYQRRGSTGTGIEYRELSDMMSTHVTQYDLGRILASADAAPPIMGVSAQQRCSLMARLLVWLFWADAQCCFLGKGGSLAKALGASSGRLLGIYERSRTTLHLYWGSGYPVAELADDFLNWPALELLHSTWIMLQRINDANDTGELTVEVADRLFQDVEALGSKHSSVFCLSRSELPGRNRLLRNADWAVCNHYAVLIYLSRCGASRGANCGSHARGDTAALLLQTAQRALSSGGRRELDRFHWSLFWAGLETDDLIYREWILSKMVNCELRATLEIAFREQDDSGSRISMERLRQISREVVTMSSLMFQLVI